MSELLDVLSEIAREAAALINAVYAKPFEVEYKSPRDPVTLADRQANELICQRLARAFPGVPVVAEESDPASFAGYRTAERAFFVDPLDGTREFVKRNGEFVVMIGLLEAGRPVAGVILAPATGIRWVGRVGESAAVVTSDARTPLSVSATPTLAQARAGSRWDLCAGEAIIHAAGGKLTDAWGEPIDYRSESLVNERGIVASNGHLHAEILARLAEARGAP